MKNRDYFSRRKFVAAASGIISGLSGCSGTSTDQDTTHTTTSKTTTRRTTTTSTTTTDKPTEDTETTTQQELNPVEHDRLVGAYYYTWYIDAYPMERSYRFLGISSAHLGMNTPLRSIDCPPNALLNAYSVFSMTTARTVRI